MFVFFIWSKNTTHPHTRINHRTRTHTHNARKNKKVYCSFETTEESTSAKFGLHGKLNNGRIIVANYYDETRFEKNDFDWIPSTTKKKPFENFKNLKKKKKEGWGFVRTGKKKKTKPEVFFFFFFIFKSQVNLL